MKRDKKALWAVVDKELNKMSVYDAHPFHKTARRTLPAAIKDYGVPCRIMDLDRWIELRQTKAVNVPPIEITEEEYEEALNCLPPMQWERESNISRFCMSEFTFASVTQQYSKYKGRYYTKPVIYRRRNTYITPELIEGIKS